MADMTEKRFRSYERELEHVKSQLEESLIAQRNAQDLGDLSENEEYATSRKHSEELAARRSELELLLAEANIVPVDRSPRISIGSTLEVCKVDSDGNPLGSPRVFTFEEKGDTILMGVLSTQSSLGKVILNGTSGIYRIPDNGGISYLVKKVIVDE